MPLVETWFPVSIYMEKELISEVESESLLKHCLNIRSSEFSIDEEIGWIGGTFSTYGTYNLSEDRRFDNLFGLITEHVNNFASMHGSKSKYKIANSWVNINTRGTFQEFHAHAGSVFSCAFYLSAPIGSGRIIFEDPKQPDMCPLREIEEETQLSFGRASYHAEQGTLLIFRSYLRHMVEPGSNEEPRVSLSANFV